MGRGLAIVAITLRVMIAVCRDAFLCVTAYDHTKPRSNAAFHHAECDGYFRGCSSKSVGLTQPALIFSPFMYRS